jgi:hypothetical protein
MYLTFTIKDSSGVRVEEVQECEWRKFRSASSRSSGAPNAAVHLENGTIFILIEIILTTTGSSRALTKAVQVCYSRQFRWAYEGSAGGG